MRRSTRLARRRLPAAVLALAAVLGLLLLGPIDGVPAAHAAGPTAVVGSTLTAGQGLAPGQALGTPLGRYQLVMQDDGNLVLYGGCGGGICSGALWALGTYGQPGNHLEMQTDGNLVLYSRSGRAVWWTSTWGADRSFTVQDDTNMVVYAPGGRAVWNAGYLSSYMHVAGQTFGDTRSMSGRYLLGTPGNMMAVHDVSNGWAVNWQATCRPDPRVDCRSNGGHLVLQDDGNLVWYQPGTGGGMVAEWSTGTWGTGPTNYAVMQDDGNFVLYALDGRPLWDSMGFTRR